MRPGNWNALNNLASRIWCAQHQSRQPPVPSGTPPQRPDPLWTYVAVHPTSWPDWMHCLGRLNFSTQVEREPPVNPHLHTMSTQQVHWDNQPRSLAGNPWNHREKLASKRRLTTSALGTSTPQIFLPTNSYSRGEARNDFKISIEVPTISIG